MINFNSVRSGSATGVRMKTAATPAAGVSTEREPLPTIAGMVSELHVAGEAGHFELNTQVSALQLIVKFVAACRESLGEIRLAAGDRLTGQAEAQGRGRNRLAGFVELWQQRVVQTAGSLDPQLQIVEPWSSRQSFVIRGLERVAQLSGLEETLFLSCQGKSSAPLALGGALAEVGTMQRLDLALASLGIRAQAHQGKLQFSINEAQWQALQGGLMVRGEGRRFPTGQHVPVRVEPIQNVAPPESWRFEELADVRTTLQLALLVDQLLEKAGATAARQLALLDASLEPGNAAMQRMQRFANAFGTQLADGGEYASLTELVPAFTHVDRRRTRTLLG